MPFRTKGSRNHLPPQLACFGTDPQVTLARVSPTVRLVRPPESLMGYRAPVEGARKSGMGRLRLLGKYIGEMPV